MASVLTHAQKSERLESAVAEAVYLMQSIGDVVRSGSEPSSTMMLGYNLLCGKVEKMLRQSVEDFTEADHA